MFSKCPRKWYYFEIVASPRARDPLRREAYILKQLQSLHAWRGSLVDRVIENFIVPRMKSNNFPSEDEIIAFSMSLMDKQLVFGKARKYQYHNITKSSSGDIYCAFYDVEYNGGLDEDTLQEAKEDVILSLRNLVRSNFLRQIMERSSFFTAQRSLVFEFENTTISCTPDLIAFFPDQPPLITDWKVHSFANTDSWLQLGVYALALSRVKPHTDFPKGIRSQLEDPTKFRLIEYQLLKNQQRIYSLSPEDLADIEDYIFKSCTQMNRLVNGKKYNELDVSKFQTARSPEICEKCQFKRLCWRKIKFQKVLLEEWT
jgi:hypothetical protein